MSEVCGRFGDDGGSTAAVVGFAPTDVLGWERNGLCCQIVFYLLMF